MQFEITNAQGIVVGKYELSPMPGCKRVGISHGLIIYEAHRGQGYATKAHAQRLEHAKQLGYRVLMATVIQGNLPQEHLLRKFKWRENMGLWNQTTDHNVALWIKNLYDPYEELYN